MHVDDIPSSYGNQVSLFFNMANLWAAPNVLNTCYFPSFGCNHDAYLDMFCREYFDIYTICVASNKLKNCSFLWFACTHCNAFELICANHVHMSFPIVDLCVATSTMNNCSFHWLVCTLHDDDFDILPYVFLPNSPLIALKMRTHFYFHCFKCNNAHEYIHEWDIFAFSYFGVFVFPHLEDVENYCLHIDLAYALISKYLCCANSVVNKNGHVTHDMLLYHTQKYFAWSLSCEGTIAYSSSSMEHGLTKQAFESYLLMSFDKLPRHRHHAKVISFYIRNHALNFKNWLLFECCFAFIVSFIGFMESEGTLKSCIISIKNDYMVNPKVKLITLPPLYGDTESSSRTTLSQGGGDDTAQPTVVAISYTPKSSWTSKVNSILYASSIHIPLNGMLPHAPSYDYARFHFMSTGAWEDATSAHGLKPDVLEAWKRRRKKVKRTHRLYRLAGGTTASAQPVLPGPLPGTSGRSVPTLQ
jgi:hypothetical protein